MLKFLKLFLLLALLIEANDSFAATLVGWAKMPMHTYAKGPTSRQFFGDLSAIDKQPVQGFSAVLASDNKDLFYFLVDNGFGTKANSADSLLRAYKVKIEFANKLNKNYKVTPVSYINIKDSEKKLSFLKNADFQNYYNASGNPKVDENIKKHQLLTGADLDPEAFQVDKLGNLWISDEFGPFLIKTDSTGKVLRKEVSLKNIISPENPLAKGLSPSVQSSGGFEAMAINPSGDKLYPMLERSLEGSDQSTLHIYEFDLNTETYSDTYYQYKKDDKQTGATDLLAINETEFLVLEKNIATKAKDNPIKKIYLIDIKGIKSGEFVKKTELVDLMNITDPDDLNQDNKRSYSFSYSHIESLLIIDKNTLLLANDNNYNYGGDTFFIKIKLDNPLRLAKNFTTTLDTSSWNKADFLWGNIFLGDHTFFGWVTVYAYFIVAFRALYKFRLSRVIEPKSKFWFSVFLFLFLLAVSRQFDLIQSVTGYFRGIYKTNGLYDNRSFTQILVILLTLTLSFVACFVMSEKLRGLWKRYKTTWIALAMLILFLSLRAVSNHSIDMIWYKKLGSLKLYQAVELLLLMLIFISTYFEKKHQNIEKIITTRW